MIFDVNKDLLRDDERLRIINGTLFVEKNQVRENTHFFYRLFTRVQYSQSECLAKIHDAALRAFDEKREFETIQINYSKLTERVQAEEPRFWLRRIDLHPHRQTQALLQVAIDFSKIAATYSSLSELAQIFEQLHECKVKCAKVDLERKVALLEDIKAKKKTFHWEVSNGDLSLVDTGNFGLICRIDQKRQIVVKIPNSRKGAQEEILSEYRFLKALHRSPDITESEKEKLLPRPVKVTIKNIIAFAVPFYPNKSLFYNRRLNISTKIEVATSLLEQMHILSQAKAVYVDIKLNNVLVDLKNKLYPFADFGGCCFEADYLLKKPVLTFTDPYVMAEDVRQIHEGTKLTLRTALDRHSSRALGLLLCELFSMRDVYFTNRYTMPELEEYMRDCQPLMYLEEDYPLLAGVIKGMLGVGRAQLPPEEAFDEWIDCHLQYL